MRLSRVEAVKSMWSPSSKRCDPEGMEPYFFPVSPKAQIAFAERLLTEQSLRVRLCNPVF